MNEKDRDRSGDGAGPSDLDAGPYWRSSHAARIVIFLLLLAISPNVHSLTALEDVLGYTKLSSQPPSLPISGYQYQRGLSLSLDVGLLVPSSKHANFYQGVETNLNTINRVLHSEAYGHQIWNDLTTLDLITSAITDYRQLNVEEYGEMSYRLAMQIGMGFRYDYGNGWGWLTRFDYAKLTATGVFLINATNNTGVLTNQRQYVKCGIMGTEKRVNIDLGVSRKFKMQNGFDIGVELGGQVNNTEVMSNDIEIANRIYNILDIWNGQSPSMGTYAYDYINQGGIGYGGFATVNFGLTMPNYSTLTLAYTFFYNKINLSGYEAFAPQHLITLRFDFDGFSFFD